MRAGFGSVGSCRCAWPQIFRLIVKAVASVKFAASCGFDAAFISRFAVRSLKPSTSALASSHWLQWPCAKFFFLAISFSPHAMA
jgi:hypothetical protein